MVLLFIIVVIILVVWLSGRSKPPQTHSQLINQQWMDYIADSYLNAKKPAEKNLLLDMLLDLARQGMPYPTQPIKELSSMSNVGQIASVEVAQASADASLDNVVSNVQPVKVPSQGVVENQPIDNATLLLYFGAFLFLAAAGLFVALAGENGILRVSIIALTSASLYAGGIWLFRTKPKLKTPAFTFAGMGMILAPLTGLAAYSYVFKESGPWMWLTTSAVCLGLYGHALRVLKNPLLEYIFLGTFVSLFESNVAILQLPVYYYGWGLTAVALIFLAWQTTKNESMGLETPTTIMANLLVPASIFTALYSTPQHGNWQLGVSLVLAAAYYALQAWRLQDYSRQNSAMLAQISGTLGVTVLAYQYANDYSHAGLGLAFSGLFAVAVSQLLEGRLRSNAATIAVGSLLAAALFSWLAPVQLCVLTAVTSVVTLGLWLRDCRPDLYVFGGLTALASPYIFGMKVIEAGMSKNSLALLVSVVLALFVGIFLLARKSKYDFDEWRQAHRGVVTISMVALFVTVLGGSGWLVLGVGLGLAAVSFALHYMDSERGYWLMMSSLSALAPILFTWQEAQVFLAATLLAWGWCLVLVLEKRSESARWAGSVAWLILPTALTHHWHWLSSAWFYALSYLVIMTGFILARSIGQKRLASLPLSLADLETKLKSDSRSYVVGYTIAAIVAYISSTDGVWYLPLLVVSALAAAAYVVSYKVERAPEIMFAAPFFAQAGIWAAGGSEGMELVWQVAVSSLVAVAFYLVADEIKHKMQPYSLFLGRAALFTSFIAPLASLPSSSNIVWSIPISLAVAGVLSLHYSWSRGQIDREVSGGVILAGFLWLAYVLGIRELQFYTHGVGVLLALYAWWRYVRQENQEKDAYIIASLAAVTIPMAAQLVTGSVSGVRGWWFLCEQIAIMLIGMRLNNKLITRWGLYVAVGAVLYQLRSLAWLALAVLAVFLISLAIYQIQKSDTK